MKYLFVGLGSIGQRHLKNLRSLTDEEIIAYDINPDPELYKQYNLKTYTNLDEALAQKPDVTFITNPTALHLEPALKAAKSGSHLFIEKPISHNLKKIETLYSITEYKNKQCFVAFNFRFHPNLIKIKELLNENKIGRVLFARIQVGQYLPDWHPDKDYTMEYSAISDLGGGVTLTLIHELDYAYWLLGEIKSVIGFVGKLSNLDIDVEDISTSILQTKSGSIIELHLDYLQKPLSRTTEIIGEKGKIIWNYSENEVKLYLSEEDKWYSFKEEFDKNDMYKNELQYFLNSISNNNKEQKITKKEIIDVMKIVEAIKKSSKEGKKIEIQ